MNINLSSRSLSIIDDLKKVRCQRLGWVLHFAMKLKVDQSTIWLVLRKSVSTNHVSTSTIIMAGQASDGDAPAIKVYEDIFSTFFNSFADAETKETQVNYDGKPHEVTWYRYKKR